MATDNPYLVAAGLDNFDQAVATDLSFDGALLWTARKAPANAGSSACNAAATISTPARDVPCEPSAARGNWMPVGGASVMSVSLRLCRRTRPQAGRRG